MALSCGTDLELDTDSGYDLMTGAGLKCNELAFLIFAIPRDVFAELPRVDSSAVAMSQLPTHAKIHMTMNHAWPSSDVLQHNNSTTL